MLYDDDDDDDDDETRNIAVSCGAKRIAIITVLDVDHKCDGWTDGQTDGWLYQ